MECHSKLNVTQNMISLKVKITRNWMSLKMECHTKWKVTQKEMSLKMECHKTECHPKKNVPQLGMSLKMECHSTWRVTQNLMSLIMKYHLKLNITKNRMWMPLKLESHSHLNVTQIGNCAKQIVFKTKVLQCVTNPAYGRHRISWPMRIVAPIFLYPLASKKGW